MIRFGLRLTLRSGREAAVRLVLTAAAVALGAGLLLRLAGATPRQVSVISAAESTAATIVGVAAGFAVFFLFRPAVAAMPFTGTPFFTGDLSLSVADIMIVAVGIPAAAAVAARLALRRVNISPLGVSRRVTPAAPRAYRAIPLLAGLVELACFVAIGRPGGTSGQILAYLPGFSWPPSCSSPLSCTIRSGRQESSITSSSWPGSPPRSGSPPLSPCSAGSPGSKPPGTSDQESLYPLRRG